MEGTDLSRYAAGTLTTLAFWTQLQKTSFTQSAGNVSLGMLFIFSTGVVLWLGYGIGLHSWPIILTNVVTLGLAVAIGALKLRYRILAAEHPDVRIAYGVRLLNGLALSRPSRRYSPLPAR